MLARTDSRARALILLVVASLVAGGIGARLAWWQIVDRERLADMALNQLAQHEEIPAERGSIIDATGELLATTIELQSIFATPPSVQDAASSAALLAPVLGMDVMDLQARLSSQDPWVWLRRREHHQLQHKLRQLHLAGEHLITQWTRLYPVMRV
jgi:cell division protein FtsI/penicillin-binding protein 2